MSRVFGRTYDLYHITKKLTDANIPRYKKDKRECSWDTIAETPKVVRMYLPDKAIEILEEKEIKIHKKPYGSCTIVHIPDLVSDERTITFPSLLPKEEFRRDFMFYVGTLLASLRSDSSDDLYGIPDEYIDVLPLLLDYLYLKEMGREDSFSIKHLNDLKGYGKQFNQFFESYLKFEKLKYELPHSNISDDEYKDFQGELSYREDELTSIAKETISVFSSLEGVLSIIDKVKSKEELKALIEQLMLYDGDNKKRVLDELGIDSLGYKRLSKEIESKMKK